MKIFLDDIRNPGECLSYMHHRIGSLNPIYLESWLVVRDYNEFIDAIQRYAGDITHVSFDHDLSDMHYTADNGMEICKHVFHIGESGYPECPGSEKTGYECAKWIKGYYKSHNLPLPVVFVHSMNPVGTERIINLFKN